MRTRTALLTGAFLVALSTVPSPARAGAAAARLALARYVALGFDTGDGFVGEVEAAPGLLPRERRALEAIRSQLEQWGRYVITARASEAEVLLAIRVGRPLAIGARVLGPGPRSGSGFEAQVSSGEDMIEVYEAVGGRPGTLLWQSGKKDGLAGERPPLFEQLRNEVEAAAKKSPRSLD
jgi:hypothetical protein